jgi:transposase-like protein
LAENLRRRRRRGKVGRSWYVDETYVKIQGRWCYLYRAIDTSGALVDVRLSETRDMAAARAFFRVRPAWAHSCGCKSRRKLVMANEAKRNCMRVTDCGEEAWSEAAGR